jgi:hypothetical protein
MLFFRSEDMAAQWCRERNAPVRPLVRFDQLWHLSVTWYGTRLTAESRRPAAADMRGIFASIGLDGDFWDPSADRF